MSIVNAVGIPFNKPSGGVPRQGMVAEHRMQRRNLLKFSEDFSNAAWVKNIATVEPNIAVAPNGTMTANRINGLTTLAYVTQTITIGSINGKKLIGSLHVKGEGTNIGKSIRIVAKRSSGTYVDSYRDITLTNEWARVDTGVFTGLSDNVDAVFTVDYQTATSCLVWGASLSFGTTPTDYEKTLDLQTLWDSKMTQVDVPNVVTNGNFANGTTGWENSGASNVMALNNEASFIPTNQYGQIFKPVNLVNGHKYYIKAMVKALKSGVFLSLQLSATPYTSYGNAPHSGDGSYKSLSFITSALSSGDTSYKIFIYDSGTSGFMEIRAREVLAVDLTALGLDHWTPAMCDYYFAPWFDGTKQIALPKGSGVLGSADGSDANDPTPTAEGYRFATNQYSRMPVPFDPNGDWTVYLVAKRDGMPGGAERVWSMANGGSPTGTLFEIYCDDATAIKAVIRNEAGTTQYIAASARNGFVLVGFKKSGNDFSIKNLLTGSTAKITNAGAFVATMTTLGAQRISTVANFLNGDIAYYAPYVGATTDATDNRMLRYVARLMKTRGITLIGKRVFLNPYQSIRASR